VQDKKPKALVLSATRSTIDCPLASRRLTSANPPSIDRSTPHHPPSFSFFPSLSGEIIPTGPTAARPKAHHDHEKPPVPLEQRDEGTPYQY
jgi:hypothetical protein